MKYKEALEATNAFSDTWQFMIDHHATIKQALKICHRLETGDVSEDAVYKGQDVVNKHRIDFERIDYDDAMEIFKAMSKQLLKEEEELR